MKFTVCVRSESGNCQGPFQNFVPSVLFVHRGEWARKILVDFYNENRLRFIIKVNEF